MACTLFNSAAVIGQAGHTWMDKRVTGGRLTGGRSQEKEERGKGTLLHTISNLIVQQCWKFIVFFYFAINLHFRRIGVVIKSSTNC